MTEVLVITALAGVSIVAVIAMFIVSRNQTLAIRLEKQMTSNKITLPLRLQAHERCLIFLERISPESIIVRINKPDYTAMQLQAQLLAAIRSEYEHNLSQQLYVSAEAWNYLVNAKNNIIGLITSCSLKLAPDMSSSELAKLILESYAKLDTSPALHAKQKLKSDATSLF